MKGEVPLVAHIIFRLDVGGLENGLINLINNMSEDKYKHVIICADTFTDFKNRIQNDDVDVYALNKKPGNDLGAYWRLWKLLRKLKPNIVHTRNLGTLEYSLVAMLAGVPFRVHGEHGRDMTDIDGSNTKYIKLRQIYARFLHQFIALSKDLEQWLENTVKIKPIKIIQLYNGVDLTRFQGLRSSHSFQRSLQQLEKNDLVFGTVGRLQAEKDQATLVRAFSELKNQDITQNIKLVLIGDGPDKNSLEYLVKELGLSPYVIFLGARNDIPELLPQLDVFVLPSKGEGISNTILEAMACGLPVIATNVGGNPELVVEKETGVLVPSNDARKLAEAMKGYVNDSNLTTTHGRAGRARVEELFSMDKMINSYMKVYDSLLSK